MNMQPIFTAPLDGTAIWLGRNSWDGRILGYWYKDGRTADGGVWRSLPDGYLLFPETWAPATKPIARRLHSGRWWVLSWYKHKKDRRPRPVSAIRRSLELAYAKWQERVENHRAVDKQLG